MYMTGQVTILSPPPFDKTRVKRSTWSPNDQIYITWNQEPGGVPNDYLPIGDDWILSGQAVGWAPLVGTVMNTQHTV